MKISGSLKSGLFRSLKSWKGVMIIWLCFLILVAVIAVPLRNSINSAFGTSMITEQLSGGLNLMTFTDLGPVLKSLVSFISGSFLFLLFIGFILNAFLTGGLFTALRQVSGKFSPSEFFADCAKNFRSFLIISFIITIIIIFLCGVIILIAMLIGSASETMPEKGISIAAISSIVLFTFLIPVLLLVADYSRAWKVSNTPGSAFRALGFGFRQTFGRFWSSYATMLILVLVQVLFGLIIIHILPSWKPETGIGILLLFIVSQLLIYARVLLKTWRYASITSLMEHYQSTTRQTSNTIL